MVQKRDEYIEWLADLVNVELLGEPDSSYYMLMRALHNKEFYSTEPMDENREGDGRWLRSQYLQNDEDDGGVCSVLEMMVALALRCADDVLYGIADASEVFWDMITNLGLEVYTDKKFDADYVDYIIDGFLDRTYDEDGRGGLFYRGNHTEIDMKLEEIWWQMQLYAMDKFDEKR